MSVERRRLVAEALFPSQPRVVYNTQPETPLNHFTIDELLAASEKLKAKKTPGVDCIPAEIIKIAVTEAPDIFLKVCNSALATGCFPTRWKCADLVLIPKKNRHIDTPSAYRALCVLDAAGKLLEHLILGRLVNHIESNDSLSCNQFGFRKGRSTIGAIEKIVAIARQAAVTVNRRKRICALVALDIKNAFNSAPRQKIVEELERIGVDRYVIRLVASYLQDRRLRLEKNTNSPHVSMDSGVPQGSILGPTLWNIVYNGVLDLELTRDVTTIAYADDLAIVVVAKAEDELMSIMNWAIEEVDYWLNSRQLCLEPTKTEAVLLTPRRNISPVTFLVQGVSITPQKSLKYLGVWLDTKLNFAEHIRKTAVKTDKTVAVLTRLMPNVGGPRSSKRRLLGSVAYSTAMYAAPIWIDALQIQRTRRTLESVFRKLAIRVCQAYRTISLDAVMVIASMPPFDLMAKERADRYGNLDEPSKQAARKLLIEVWQSKWSQSTRGSWTRLLIPQISAWIGRSHGEVDFFTTQMLSGHGCFGAYLHRFGIRDGPECIYCGEEDDARHTFFDCRRWDPDRSSVQESINVTLTPENVVEQMLASESKWNSIAGLARKILTTKRIDMNRPTETSE
nr:unnamed protein product [Callosobruchus chinensis]